MAEKQQDKLKFVDIEKITPGERFRKDYGDLDALVGSIKEKGILQPITLDPSLKLLAGGRRLAAAKKVGLTQIPCLIRDRKFGEDEAEIDYREVELIENTFRKDFTWQEQVALTAELDRLMRKKNSEWSTRKTAALLGQSHPMNVMRALQLQEGMELIPELKDVKTADEAMKMLKKVEEKLITTELRKRQEQIKDSGMKDMLKIADANYRIGDALQGMEGLPSGSGAVGPTLIEVDPPYGIDLNEQKKQTDGTNIVKTYNEVDKASYQTFIEKVAKQTFRVARANSWMIFWYGPSWHQMILESLRGAGWKVDEIPAIWYKGGGQTNAVEVYLARSYEPFFVCLKGSPIFNKRGRSNVFDFPPVAGTKKYHPTERPISLMTELLEVFTFEGAAHQTVLVPFLGSGVTLRASYLRGISCYGWDLNGEYKDKFLLAVEEDTKQLNKEKPEEK